MSKDFRFNKDDSTFEYEDVQNIHRDGKSKKRDIEASSTKNKRSYLRRAKEKRREYEFVH